MKDVFISYNSPKRETAEAVLAYLENDGFVCFFDKRDMPGGQSYGGALVRAMKDCQIQLFLFSAEANKNEKNILAELETAWKNKIPCLTVLLDDSEPNDDIEYYINSRHMLTAYPEAIDTYLPQILASVKKLVPEKSTPAEVEEEVVSPTTEFDYDPKTGSMFNPEDNQRNVSFRTDTFINMMGGIYEKVAKVSDLVIAQEIFFESGYAGGKSFAERINSKWASGFSIEEMQKKIKKWCAFDSAVGWGKFEAEIDFDEENDTFSGTLTITEAFIIDYECRRKVCAFIRGYCTGVLDTLLGNLNVELTCRSCPLEKRLSRKCVFDIKMKG